MTENQASDRGIEGSTPANDPFGLVRVIRDQARGLGELGFGPDLLWRGELHAARPQVILVVAGSSRQFEVWRSQQAPEVARAATYLATSQSVRGWDPASVAAVVMYGQWWSSDIYLDQTAWRYLLQLEEDVQYLRTGERPQQLDYEVGGGVQLGVELDDGQTQVKLDFRSPGLKSRWEPDEGRTQVGVG